MRLFLDKSNVNAQASTNFAQTLVALLEKVESEKPSIAILG